MTTDEMGMIWWNGLTRAGRMAALLAVDPVSGNASPKEAWEHWRGHNRPSTIEPDRRSAPYPLPRYPHQTDVSAV